MNLIWDEAGWNDGLLRDQWQCRGIKWLRLHQSTHPRLAFAPLLPSFLLKLSQTLHSGNSDNSGVRSIWTISSLHKTSQLFFSLLLHNCYHLLLLYSLQQTVFTAEERWVKTNLAFKVRGSGFQHPDSIWSISNSIASLQPPFSTEPAEGWGGSMQTKVLNSTGNVWWRTFLQEYANILYNGVLQTYCLGLTRCAAEARRLLYHFRPSP